MDYQKFTSYKKIVGRQKWAVSGKNQTYLEILLTFLTIAFFIIFALRPTILTISELTTDKQNLEELNTKFDQKLEALVAAVTAYDNAKPKLPLIEQALPNDEKVTEAMAQIEIIARESNLVLESISFDEYPLNDVNNQKLKAKARSTARKDKNAKDYDWLKLGFSVSATGDFSSVRDFIINTGKLRRLILIEGITISQSSTNTNDQHLRFTLNGQVVYYP